MIEIEEWLNQYEADVRFPDVSGMEHLDMLLTRSRIAAHQEEMMPEQHIRLLEADRQLYSNAEAFFRAIARVADLSVWRNDSAVSPEDWWWYLDVLASVPQFSMAQD